VALGTMAHDMIMTPMDVCKQRLQLGNHKNNVFECACDIMRQEGPRAFLLSYPTTLLMNLPYAVVMGSVNEWIRLRINPTGDHSLGSYMLAGAGAGLAASAVTNPLDVIKTRLQTQHCAAAIGGGGGGGEVVRAGGQCPRGGQLAYRGLVHAATTVWFE